MELDLQYDLANLTPANAAPVQANFSRVEQYINQEVIRRDGTIAMEGQLKLAGSPSAPLDAIPLQYLNAILPVGIIVMWSADVAPPGGTWLIADGTLKAVADFPELFNVCQYRWGGAGGNFALPMGNGLTPISPGGAVGGTIGAKGGTKDAVLVDHQHNARHAHTNTVANADTNHRHPMAQHDHRGTTDPGGGHAHGWSVAPFWYNGAAGGFGGLTPGVGNMQTTNWAAAPDHVHGFTTGLGGATNTSYQSDATAVDGGDRYTHKHTVTVDEANYNTGAPIGPGVFPVAATNGNLPPYAVVPYIVRAR